MNHWEKDVMSTSYYRSIGPKTLSGLPCWQSAVETGVISEVGRSAAVVGLKARKSHAK